MEDNLLFALEIAQALENIFVIAISTVGFYLGIDVLAPKLCEIFMKRRYIQLSAKDQAVVENSVVCGLNGGFAFVAACYILVKYDFKSDLLGSENSQVKVLACVETGYFIADIVMLLKKPEASGRNTYLAHDVTCLVAYYVVLWHRYFAFHMMLRTINEFSTPFFIVRTILARLNLKNERIYVANRFLYLVTFFVGRILLMPIIYYTLWSAVSSQTYASMSLFCLGSFYVVSGFIDILNVYWFTFIVKGFLKYLSRTRSSVKQK